MGQHHRAHVRVSCGDLPWWRKSADPQVNTPLSSATCHPAFPTSPESGSTTRSRCSRSSFSERQARGCRDAARPRAAVRRAAADPAQLLEPDQEPIAPDRRAPGAAVRAAVPQALRMDGPAARALASPMSGCAAAAEGALPQDDDERFIVGLVLTYYRRHPQRARSRLLELLGEALTPSSSAPPPRPAPPPPRAGTGPRTVAAQPSRCSAAETQTLTP